MTYGEISKITLYKNCSILIDKNFKVDDIMTYLSNMSGNLSFNTAQMIKQGLNITIKLQIDQNTNEIMTTSNYNYCRIINARQDSQSQVFGKECFYFILNKKWISTECVELTLKMDTLNTLGNYVSISDKTTIMREHKNRWKAGNEPNLYFPIVDLYSEGITSPLFKVADKTCYPIEYNEMDEQSYYLIYMASEEGVSKPIDIYLTADEPMVIDRSFTYWSGTFNARAELRSKYGAIIYGADNVGGLNNIGCEIKFKNTDGDDIDFVIGASNQAIIILNSMIRWGVVRSSNGYVDTSGLNNMRVSQAKKIQITGLAKMRVCDRSIVRTASSYIPTLTDTYILSLPYASEYAPIQEEDVVVIGITDVDRTHGRISKIVKLPYCPIQIDRSDDKRIPPSDWEVVSWPLEPVAFKTLHYRFRNEPACFISEHNLETLEYNLVEPFGAIVQRQISDWGRIIPRNKDYETKLFHSDYLLQKFVYDSFSYSFRCEFMDDVDGATNLRVKMATTSSMGSNFFFTFTNNNLKIDNEDYSNLMMITRNNEVILYNSSYLDYIRNGYNYDKKTRNRNLALSIASLGLGLVGDTAGIFGDDKSKDGEDDGNKSKIISGIKVGARTINSVFRTIGQTAQADQNIEQKLRMSLYQGVSVAGADELDLLSEYAVDNKPKMVVYKVSEKMEDCLFDLFYYCGYIGNYQGVPNETSRKVFNFIQADIVFNTITRNIPQEVLSDYKDRYLEGITVIHHYTLKDENDMDVRGWDFEQTLENWETSLS